MSMGHCEPLRTSLSLYFNYIGIISVREVEETSIVIPKTAFLPNCIFYRASTQLEKRLMYRVLKNIAVLGVANVTIPNVPVVTYLIQPNVPFCHKCDVEKSW